MEKNILTFVLGFIIGIIIMSIIFLLIDRKKYRPIGDLRIDRSDPTDSPLLFLELNEDTTVHSIMSKKAVTFTVKTENFLPHK